MLCRARDQGEWFSVECRSERPARAEAEVTRMILLTELEEFAGNHRPHGALTCDATEPAWNGYSLTVSCPCGVAFERWVIGQDAELDLLRLAAVKWPGRRARRWRVGRAAPRFAWGIRRSLGTVRTPGARSATHDVVRRSPFFMALMLSSRLSRSRSLIPFVFRPRG